MDFLFTLSHKISNQTVIDIAIKVEFQDVSNQEINNLFDHYSRPKRLEVLYNIIKLRKDVILIIKTDFGKTLSIQAVTLLIDGICLVVIPLILLRQEQTKKFNDLASGKDSNVTLMAIRPLSERCHTNQITCILC